MTEKHPNLPALKVNVTRMQALVMFLFVVLAFVVLAAAFEHVTSELRKSEINQQASFVYECRTRNQSAAAINSFVDQLVVSVTTSKTLSEQEKTDRLAAYTKIRQKVNTCPPLPKDFHPKVNPTTTNDLVSP